MSTTMEIRDDRLLAGRGLSLPDGLEFEEWAKIGRELTAAGNAVAWKLADWLNYGFWEYGEKYQEALAVTGYEYGTLRNIASVGAGFELSRRRDNLSFGHHAAVSSLDKEAQDTWLTRAEAEGLSVMALREALQEPRQLASSQTTVTLEQIRFTVPPDRAERWKSAAEKSGQAFSEWAASVLDQAAA